MLMQQRKMLGGTLSSLLNINSGCSFLSPFRHARRKVLSLPSSILLGPRAGAIDLRPFEQMEQQGHGPRASRTPDLVHMELRRVLGERRCECPRL